MLAAALPGAETGNSLVSLLMSHKEGGVGPAAQRPEAQEGEREPEFNLCSSLQTHIGLTHTAGREFMSTHAHEKIAVSVSTSQRHVMERKQR